MMIIIMTASYKGDDVGNGHIVHSPTTYIACHKWGQIYCGSSSKSPAPDHSRFMIGTSAFCMSVFLPRVHQQQTWWVSLGKFGEDGNCAPTTLCQTTTNIS